MAITQKQIAEELGISRGLVGLALNGHPDVNDETRQRVQKTAQSLGYRPNSAARALVTGRTGQIVFRSFSPSPAVNVLTRGLIEEAGEHHSDLLISFPGTHHRSLELPSCDGAFFFGNVPSELVLRGFPAVSLQIDLRGLNAGHLGEYDVIQVEHETAAREAVCHLVSQGCRRIAYVSVASMMGSYEPRYRAWSSVLKKAGLPCEEICLSPVSAFALRDETHRALLEYSANREMPDALFCSCDDIALGAYRALRELGRTIPTQTAIIGSDDLEESRDQWPALSTLQWPGGLATLAWKMLTERIADPHLEPRLIRLQARYIARTSSRRDFR